jgi:hypothetical protein
MFAFAAQLHKLCYKAVFVVVICEEGIIYLLIFNVGKNWLSFNLLNEDGSLISDLKIKHLLKSFVSQL